MQSSLFRRIMCLLGQHRLYVIAQVSRSSRHIGCRDCPKQWGMNDDAGAFLPWGDVADLHRDLHGYEGIRNAE